LTGLQALFVCLLFFHVKTLSFLSLAAGSAVPYRRKQSCQPIHLLHLSLQLALPLKGFSLGVPIPVSLQVAQLLSALLPGSLIRVNHPPHKDPDTQLMEVLSVARAMG